MVAQPEHQLLAGTQVTECAADGCHCLAVHTQERLRVVQPIADLHCENFTPVCGRRQGLAREPPGLRELLAGHDEAILDPPDTRRLAACGCTSQAASGLSVLAVRGGRLGVRRSGLNTSRPWQLQPLLADRRAKSAEVFAEASNGGFELRDAAQQDGSAEIGAHVWILSKSGQLSKCSKRRHQATPTGDGGGGSPFVLSKGELSPNPAAQVLNEWALVTAMPITNLNGIALL